MNGVSMKVRIGAFFVAVMMMVYPVYAEDTLGDAAKTVGSGVVSASKTTGKQVAQKTGWLGKILGNGALKTGQTVGETTLDVTKATAQSAEKVGSETIEAVKKVRDLFYDPVVVSATRLPSQETRVSTIPANMTVITAADIKASGAQTVQEALRKIEGINMYDSVGNGIDTVVNMRGFTNGEEIAVLVDGVRVNETDLNVFNPNLINVDTIESIEVTRGASSALYGDSVFGGIINIKTKQPSDKLYSPFGNYEFGSFRHQNFTSGVSGTVRDKYLLGIPGNAKYFFSGSRHLDGGYRDNGDSRATFFDGKVGYELEDETGEVMFNLKYTDQENHNPGELTLAEYEANRQQTAKPDDNRKWENLILSVDANKSVLEDHLVFDFNAYRRLNDIDFTSTYRSGTQEEFLTLSAQKGCVGQVTYNETLGEFANALTGGLEYSNAGDNYNTLSYPSTLVTSDTSLDKDDFGMFFQDSLTIYERLILNFGMRHDEVSFHFFDHNTAANGAKSRFDETTLKTGFVIKPVTFMDLYGNYAQAFKAPGSSEMFNTTGWGGNDPSLSPERADSYELGTRFRYKDKSSLKLAYFYIDTQDEIQSIETAPWTYVNRNIGRTRRYGFETSLNVNPVDYVDVYGTHTFTDARTRAATTYVQSGRELGLVPENMFTTGFHIGQLYGFDYWFDGVFVGRQPVQSAETNSFSMSPIEPYCVFNTKLSYTIKGIEFYVKVENLLDRNYYTRAIYNWTGSTLYVTPAPERTMYSGVRFEF